MASTVFDKAVESLRAERLAFAKLMCASHEREHTAYVSWSKSARRVEEATKYLNEHEVEEAYDASRSL